MSKYIIRKKRRIYPKKKWCPVFINFGENEPQITVNSQTVQTITRDLCVNSAATSIAPTATIIKCGYFKVSFELDSQLGNSQVLSGFCAIMFVPQGLTPDKDYPTIHPEYMMAWRSFNIGTPNSNVVTIQSGLKRNLNSGDRVIFFIRVINNSESVNFTFKLQGAVTYVCRNN